MSKRVRLGLLLVGGLVVGSALQRTTSDIAEESKTGRQEGVKSLQSQSKPAALPPPDVSRPPLDEIFAASDGNLPVLAVRFLREATIDDVTALLTGIYDRPRNRSLGDVTRLAIMRGVDLDPSALVEAVRAYPHMPQRTSSSRLYAIFNAWAAFDPEAALAASRHESDYLRRATIEAVANEDPVAALAMAQSLMSHDEELLGNVRKKYLAQLAATDVQAALDQTTSIENSKEQYRTLGAVVEVWAARDPFAAIDWLNAKYDLPNRSYLLETIIGYAVKADPAAAQRAIETSPLVGSQRFGLERMLAAEWAATDPARAIEMIRKSPNAQQRARLLEAYITRASPMPDEIVQLLADVDIPITMNQSDAMAAAVRHAFAEIAKESLPRAVQKAVDTFGVGSHNFETMVRAIAEDGASSNPAAAADWAFGLSKSASTQELKETVLRMWSKTAPEDAAKFLESKEMLDEDFGQLLARAWAESDAPALLNWAANLAPENREGVLATAVKQAAWYYPAEASKYIDLLSSQKTQSQTISSVASGLQRTDPVMAVEWLATLPSGRDVGDDLTRSAKAAVLTNPQAASKLIGELPSGSRRDKAVIGMVEALLSKENPARDLKAAAEWAANIENPDWQRAALRYVERSISTNE